MVGRGGGGGEGEGGEKHKTKPAAMFNSKVMRCPWLESPDEIPFDGASGSLRRLLPWRFHKVVVEFTCL